MNQYFPVAIVAAICLGACTSAGTTADAACKTSGTRWIGGDTESPEMNPGLACITCHTSGGEGPKYQIAGTVYSEGDDADTCNGISATAIEIIGADGTTVTATSNAAGNFFLSSGIKMPYTARVLRNGKARKMTTKQENGDCNACHTAKGAEGAPGRIITP